MKTIFDNLEIGALLSPMSGITDVAFRSLCAEYGADITYTEFTHSSSILNGEDTLRIKRSSEEKIVGCQLFGNNIEEVVEAAKHVEDKFDLIDINCGCPAWKVIKSGSGSALLNNPSKIHSLVERLVEEVHVPVTVKIRIGIDKENINALNVSKAIQRAGGAAIAIHGRTTKQGYSGKADWDVIKKVKQNIDIPVIGNGDIFTPEDYKEKMSETGVDAIMIARGAMGNPHLFKNIKEYLEKGTYTTNKELEAFFSYYERAVKEGIQTVNIKKQAMQFTKGMRGGSTIRKKLTEANNKKEIYNVLNSVENPEFT